MMKMSKKTVSIILVIITFLLIFPMAAMQVAAISGECGAEDGSVKWNLDITTGELTISGTGWMKDYSIDSPAPWGIYCDYIKTVTITDGVCSVGDYAFDDCNNLTDITIPSSVMSVGKYAFHDLPMLTSIDVASDNRIFFSVDGVLFGTYDEFNIGKCTILITFPAGKTDTEYTVPYGVTRIGMNAFYNNINMTSVTFPSSITRVDCFAFYSFMIGRTSSITDIYFNGDAPNVYASSTGMGSFDKNITLHYVKGRSGWIDNEDYDSSAGTWCGYKLAVWDGDPSVDQMTEQTTEQTEIVKTSDDDQREQAENSEISKLLKIIAIILAALFAIGVVATIFIIISVIKKKKRSV